MIDARQPGQAGTAGTPCLTDATYGCILVAMLSPQVGGLTEGSVICIQDFSVEQPLFKKLARVGTLDPSMMSEEEFVEILEDGLRLYQCMTDDELRAIQKASAHALASFGEWAASRTQ